MRLIFVELQCTGYTHVPFNSALLVTARHAFPQSEIRFLGEELHITNIQQYLSYFDIPAETVHWQSMVPITGRTVSFRLKALAKLLAEASRLHADAVVLTSMDGLSLLVLKSLLMLRSIDLKVIVVLHTVVSNIASLNYLKQTLFRGILLHANREASLSYVVLAPTILNNVVRLLPGIEGDLDAIDLPYLFKPVQLFKQSQDLGQSLRFGFLGTDLPGKGYSVFMKLSEDMAMYNSDLRQPVFTTVNYASVSHKGEDFLERFREKDQLLYDAYDRAMKEVDYFVFPYSADRYAFTASGAFLDAVAIARPCVVLRTPLFEGYFGQMGSIGYICQDYSDLYNTILNIIHRFPTDIYFKQQQNIINGRQIFEPSFIAPILRALIMKRVDMIDQDAFILIHHVFEN